MVTAMSSGRKWYVHWLKLHLKMRLKIFKLKSLINIHEIQVYGKIKKVSHNDYLLFFIMDFCYSLVFSSLQIKTLWKYFNLDYWMIFAAPFLNVRKHFLNFHLFICKAEQQRKWEREREAGRLDGQWWKDSTEALQHGMVLSQAIFHQNVSPCAIYVL